MKQDLNTNQFGSASKFENGLKDANNYKNEEIFKSLKRDEVKLPLLTFSNKNEDLFGTKVFKSAVVSEMANKPRYTKILEGLKMEDLAAGLTGGIFSTLILHPLDLIKVRFAVNDGQVTTRPKYDGLLGAFRTIYKDEGPKGLFRGVVPNSVGAGVAWGLYFLFYNMFKSQMQTDKNTFLKPWQHMQAAAEAGLLSLVFTNPIWVVKTRLCLQYGSCNQQSALPASKQYNGMSDTFRKIYRYEGLRGFYKGFIPGMWGVSHGALQFTAYEEIKKWYIKRNNLDPNEKLGKSEWFLIAIASKMIATSVTYPIQVVRARLQDQHQNYKGPRDVIERILRLEGYKGFYKGMVPNLLRVGPASALTIVIYEYMKHSLSEEREIRKGRTK